MTPTVDVRIESHGSIVVVQPMTPAARTWLDANVSSEPWQWMGDGLCVDWRYATELAAGMMADGLSVKEPR